MIFPFDIELDSLEDLTTVMQAMKTASSVCKTQGEAYIYVKNVLQGLEAN